jgi:hypothetical protein
VIISCTLAALTRLGPSAGRQLRLETGTSVTCPHHSVTVQNADVCGSS